MRIISRLQTHAKALGRYCFLSRWYSAGDLHQSWITGLPWDEPWEQDILRMNLNEYVDCS